MMDEKFWGRLEMPGLLPTSGVARLRIARGRSWKCRPFHLSNLLTRNWNERRWS